jgi:uncharacterized repeat protein (TIGR01451 family)
MIMKRLVQTLAVGGTVSIFSFMGWSIAADHPWAGSADESASEEAAPSRPAGRPTISSKPRLEDGILPRNYYQELFKAGEVGEHKPVEPEKKPAARKPATQAKAPAKPAPNRLAKKPNAEPAAKKAGKAPALAENETAEEWPHVDTARVIKADLDSEDADHEKGKIQQVRVETRPRVSRIPVPPLRQQPRTARVASSLNAAQQEPAPAAAASGPHASAVSLEWVKKSDFNVGQECAVELVVKNTGSSPAEHVSVEAHFHAPIRLVSAKPQPIENQEHLTWELGTLAPGSEHRIALKLIPSRRGELGLQAHVRLTGSAKSTFRVEEPLLKVAVTGPADVTLGDSATQMVTVSYPGTGAAQDVKIFAKLSSGLEHARGGRETEMEVGTIMPGESRTIRLPLTCVKGGEQSVSVTATTPNSEASNVATTSIQVLSPSLAIAADGPALRYKGRNAKYTVKVANDGSVANNNVRVTQAITAGFQFVSADHGGKYDAALNTVSWFLGRMDAAQEIEVSCELTPVALGDFAQKISVASDAGAHAEDEIETKVDGAASLTMEIVDLDDPVEVGVETAYEIRVKNGGSKAAHNVSLHCELPSGVQLISAKGATDAAAEKHVLKFKPLSQLAPGQESVFKVHVKGLSDGNQRVKARLSSDSLAEPLLQEEQTKFYSDTRR